MATSNPIKWTTHGTWSTPLDSELTGLTTNAYGVTADSIDNRGGDQYADFIYYANASGAITAGGYGALWFIKSIDGTTGNYERGATSGVAPARAADVVFPLDTTSDQQSVYISAVQLPNARFKVLFKNVSGVALDATSNLNKIIYVPYNDQLIAT
jgi:hypothetical protein